MNKNLFLHYGCWTLSLGYFWFHLFDAQSLPLIIKTVYNSVERVLWASAVCWIVFACHCLKSGGPFKSFLSNLSWQPLSKLTLSVYLVHIPYIMYSSSNFPTPFGFSWITHIYFGDICVAVIAGFFAHILIEVPASSIVTLICTFLKLQKRNFFLKPDRMELKNELCQ